MRKFCRPAAIVGAVFVLLAMPAQAETLRAASPYAAQKDRQIKSLSAGDIEELMRGGGWGFAKAAELNGVPGPAHLLELKDQIPLNAEQVDAIQALFDRMRVQAKEKGAALIALERALDYDFRTGTLTEETLRASLAEIASIRGALRFIHLSTHLRTPQILSRDQIARYNALRGYAKTDPCGTAPEGHDAAKWRRHNGC